MTRRTQQVGEMLRAEIDDIIRTEVKDPRIGFFSITHVDVPTDLRSARVFVSVLGSESERDGTMKALEQAAGFVRFHLKPRLRMRQIPEIIFKGDRSMEYAAEITEALAEVRARDEEMKASASENGQKDQGEE